MVRVETQNSLDPLRQKMAKVFAAFALIATPLTNTYSRYLERAADECALRLTGNTQTFVEIMTKLTNQNLSETQPSRWVELLFYDHPPCHKRLSHAQQYRQ